MKYLSKFNTDPEYQEKKNGFEEVNVSWISEIDEVRYHTTLPNGVYIVHKSNEIYTKDTWNTSWNSEAAGVGFKTNKYSALIAPTEQNSIQWGLKGTLLNAPVITTTDTDQAKLDYSGAIATPAIVAQIGTQSYNYAAKYCHEYMFKNGQQGYLPAAGELWEAYELKAGIDECMEFIGGTPLIASYRKLSSTQSSANEAWTLSWSNRYFDGHSKSYTFSYSSTRPFSVWKV